MNELALFSGAGGGILASSLLGNNIVCAVERDAFCRSILIRRQNEGLLERFPIWDDIRTFNGRPWSGTVDLVSGGFPCQAFSSAARNRNIPEKDLWREMFRVIGEVLPRVVFAENVSEKAIQKAKNDLLDLGYKSHIVCLSASDLGADHRRKRFWLFAYTDVYSKLCRENYAETPMLQKLCNGFWQTIPNELRDVDGVAYRMDRLRSIGNGQVPLVATVAFLEGYWRMLNDAA